MALPPESYDPRALQDIEDAVAAARRIIEDQKNATNSGQEPKQGLADIAIQAGEIAEQKQKEIEATKEALQAKIQTMAEQVFSGDKDSPEKDQDIANFSNQFRIEPKHDGSGEMVIYYYYPQSSTKSSDVLYLIGRGLTVLDIPTELQITRLDCSYNQLTSIRNLPAGLTWLGCEGNKITNFGNLPAGLTWLDCQSNQITSLDNLPAGLTKLFCEGNQLTILDNLPAGLTELFCSENKLTNLGNLPVGLTVLNCSTNQLTILDNLPAGLNWLSCGENQLTNLDNLPAGLTTLDCTNNPLSQQSKEYIKSRGFNI